MNCSYPLTYVIKQGDNLYHISQHYQTTVPLILSQNPGIDPYNLQIGSTIMVCPGNDFSMDNNSANLPSCPNPSRQISLINNMRLLWEQHVYWTRMLLISIAERLKDQPFVGKRILRNPGDFAKLFSNYYNSDVVRTIKNIITEHLQIGEALIIAQRDGQTAKAIELNRQWYANADKWADEFSSINPYYNREQIRKMLYEHLELTKQEVSARLSGNYQADIDTFDKVERAALEMADYFSSGLMSQFPQKFS